MKASTLNRYSRNTVPQLLKKAEKIFNEYIRLRDRKNGVFTCISCRQIKPADSRMHAGHYMSAGHHYATRFNEDNVFGQCERCNTFLHGNLIEYRKSLVMRYGEDFVCHIESMAKKTVKQDRFALSCIIEEYNKKVKELKEQNK